MRLIKRVVALLLVLLLSIESFAAIVGDNDGSAFITKAEFDSLKNEFQSQIDQYNTSIDSKIDGAIAGYLAGVRVSQFEDVKSIINKKYVWLETVGDDSVLGWTRVNNAISYNASCNVYFFRTTIDALNSNIRQGSIGVTWTPKSTTLEKKSIYVFDKVTSLSNGYLRNPSKDKRSMSGEFLSVINYLNGSASRYMTSNFGSACPSFGSIMYNVSKDAAGTSYETARKAKWQEGLLYGQEFDSIPLRDWRPISKYPNNKFAYSLGETNGADPTRIHSESSPGGGNIVNFTVPSSSNSNYMMDVTYSYEPMDIIPEGGIQPWYNASETLWPNTIPFDWLIPSIWIKKTVDKSRLAYYDSNIVNVSENTDLKNYFDNYSWNRGFPMWMPDNSGILTFTPEFENVTDTYLVWCLKGPSDSNVPYTTAPSNYYTKNDKCTLTQIVTGNGKGAIKCKSGDKIIIDDIEKGDIVYLYFTTEDGKAGPKLKSQIQASLEKE